MIHVEIVSGQQEIVKSKLEATCAAHTVLNILYSSVALDNKLIHSFVVFYEDNHQTSTGALVKEKYTA